MKLLYASAVYVGMGLVLGLGIFLAVKGSFWLLILSALAYIFAVGKIGCMPH